MGIRKYTPTSVITIKTDMSSTRFGVTGTVASSSDTVSRDASTSAATTTGAPVSGGSVSSAGSTQTITPIATRRRTGIAASDMGARHSNGLLKPDSTWLKARFGR